MDDSDSFDAESMWTLSESCLIEYLMRARSGESVDLLLLELEANASHPDGDDL